MFLSVEIIRTGTPLTPLTTPASMVRTLFSPFFNQFLALFSPYLTLSHAKTTFLALMGDYFRIFLRTFHEGGGGSNPQFRKKDLGKKIPTL